MRFLAVLLVLFLAVVIYVQWDRCGQDVDCWLNAFSGHPGNYRPPKIL